MKLIIAMKFTITKANPDDSTGIHKLLLKNLIEVQDVKALNPDRRHTLETEGFLRKEVAEAYYADLIQNPDQINFQTIRRRYRILLMAKY